MLILTCLLVLVASTADAQIRLRQAPAVVEEPSGVPYDDGEHPSMLINSNNIDALRTSVSSGGHNHTRFDAMVDEVDAAWDTMDDSFSNGVTQRRAFQVAVIYTLCPPTCTDLTAVEFAHTRTEYGAKAKVLIDLVVASGGSVDDVSTLEQGFLWCNAFDMVYALYTVEEVATVKDFIDGIDAFSQTHMAQSQTAMRRTAQLVCAAALGEGDVWGKAHVDAFSTKFRSATGITAFVSAFAGTGGGDWPEGPSYMWSYYWPPLIVAEESYRTMKGISKATHWEAADAAALPHHVFWMLYNEEPWEVASADPGSRHYVYYASFKIAARTALKMSQGGLGFRDAARWIQAITEGTALASYGRLARWWEENRSGTPVTTGATAYLTSPLWIVISPTTVPTAESPTTQGIALRARAGLSQYVFRTDWTTANAPVVRVSAQQYTGDTTSYRPANPGGIWIGRQGPMLVKKYSQSGHGAMNNGTAGGQGGFIFVDRVTQDIKTAANDAMGGARFPQLFPLDSTADLASTDQTGLSDLRSWLANGSTRTINYVGQSLAESFDRAAYTQTNNTNKVVDYYDHTFYLEPADADADPVLVVKMARIKTPSTNIVPTLLMHPAGGSPTVTGASSTTAFARYPAAGCGAYDAFFPSEAVSITCATTGTSGWTRYVDPTSISDTQTFNGMSGQITITPLQPSGTGERTLERVGGPDDAANDWDNNATNLKSFELVDPYGAQFAQSQDDGMQEAYSGGGGTGTSAYTFYLSKTTQTTGNQWFNVVYEVGDNGSTPVTPGVTTNGAGDNDFICTILGTRFVCAGEDGESKTAGDFIFPDATVTYTGLVCALEKSANATFTGGASIGTIDSEGDTDGTVAIGTSGCAPLSIPVTSGGDAASRTITVS